MPFDFDGALKEAERSGLVSGGDRFKIKEGGNKIRLASNPLPFQGSYQGKKNFKWLVYILDRADGQAKLFFMPHTIFRQVGDLQKSDDYRFFEMPMDYDITVQAKGAGTKDVEYSVIPSPKRSPLTKDELKALSEKKPLEEVRKALAEKQEKPQETEQHFDPDEIPI